jgi:hypothetical protein
MKGKSMKPRLISVFPHREKEKDPLKWYRKYYDPKIDKVIIKESLSQRNETLMRGKDRITGLTR